MMFHRLVVIFFIGCWFFVVPTQTKAVPERETERVSPLRSVLCCRCDKNTQPDRSFCARFSNIQNCGDYRNSTEFATLGELDRSSMDNYNCQERRDALCNLDHDVGTGATPPTTPTAPAAARPAGTTTPPTPATGTEGCPRVFADVATAVSTFNPPVAASAATPPARFESITPRLSVLMPGLTFSPAEKKDDGYVYVPFLSQYIAALYRYLVGLSLLAATVMIVYGGFRYLLGASIGDIQTGKQMVVDAIIGLILVLGAYAILALVNPNTLDNGPIKLQYITNLEANFGNNAGADLPIMSSSGGTPQRCRCTRIPSQVNPNRILAVPCYFQNRGEWGRTKYGMNLIPEAERSNIRCHIARDEPNLSLPNCNPHDPALGRSVHSNNRCIGTIGQDGCGATALATVLAYHRAQINGHLVTPLDTATMAVRSCARPHNGGTDVGGMTSSDNNHQHHGSSKTSWYFYHAFPNFTVNTFAVRDPAGLQRAKREIEQGNPLIFACVGCRFLDTSGNTRTGFAGGHYMVLNGVSEDGSFFSVHDVGGGVVIGISAADLAATVGSVRLIKPNNQAPRTPAQVEHCNASDRLAGGLTGSSRGGVGFRTFTYCPGGESRCAPEADRIGWIRNQAWIMYPASLTSASDKSIRLYIYIHGFNTSRDPSWQGSPPQPHDNHVRILQGVLQRANPNKKIVIAGPHWMGAGGPPPFMQGLDLVEFYNTAFQTIRTAIPGATVRDVSIGGHSGATCGTAPLRQAITAAIDNKYGYIIYDGCPGDTMNSRNFSPSDSHPLLINPDIGPHGMGADRTPQRWERTNTSWELFPCSTVHHASDGDQPRVPPYLSQMLGSSVQCFRSRTHPKWWSFVSALGHGESVGPMTQVAFRALYGE